MNKQWSLPDNSPAPIAKIGMDCLIEDYTWGKIEKITSAWGGTLFVRTSPSLPLRKFDKSGCERTNDAWHSHSLTLHTPESKEAYKAKKQAKLVTIHKANALKAVRWETLSADNIASIYDLAVSKGVIVIET